MKLLITGGTIDKEYNPITGKLELSASQIIGALSQGGCHVNFDIEQVFLEDSLDISDAQREEILNHVLNGNDDQILITHGTDTMVNTAQLLSLYVSDKTIVLTGSMIPYKVVNSDALFNLGAAIVGVQCLPPGVYICMHGKIFEHNKVSKVSAAGEFHSKK